MITISADSLKLAKIEDNLLKLYDILIGSQPIRRYSTYLDNDPLSVNKADIDSDEFIDSDTVILTPFDERVMTSEIAKIFLNPMRGSLKKKPLSDIKFVLDIVIPTDKWRIKESGLRMRAFRILDEYSKLIDGKNIAGIGPVEITEFEVVSVGSHTVLKALIIVNSSTLKSGE